MYIHSKKLDQCINYDTKVEKEEIQFILVLSKSTDIRRKKKINESTDDKKGEVERKKRMKKTEMEWSRRKKKDHEIGLREL